MILGIDTTAGQCAVALIDAAGRLLALRAERMERGHAEALWPLVDFALAEARAGYPAISRIGVCTGPGSFTGIRVGVAAARGLALGRGIPAIGVSRFEALAAVAEGPVAVALAAPRETVFLQIFGPEGAEGPPRRLPQAELERHLPAGLPCCGDALGPAEAGLPSPERIARLAARARPDAPPAPLYLREADAAPPRRAPPARIG